MVLCSHALGLNNPSERPSVPVPDQIASVPRRIAGAGPLADRC